MGCWGGVRTGLLQFLQTFSGVSLPPIPLQLPTRGHTPSWIQNVSTRLQEQGFHLDKSLLAMPMDVSKVRLQN